MIAEKKLGLVIAGQYHILGRQVKPGDWQRLVLPSQPHVLFIQQTIWERVMPFTPLHLGPAVILKGVLNHRFSFMVFGGTQVLMDIEPLLGLMYGWDILHGPTHTFIGATGIALGATILGKPISNFALSRLNIPHKRITWSVSALSAFIGAWSHIVLDSIWS